MVFLNKTFATIPTFAENDVYSYNIIHMKKKTLQWVLISKKKKNARHSWRLFVDSYWRRPRR